MNSQERRRQRILKAIMAYEGKLGRLDPASYGRERDYRRLVTYYGNRIAWGLKLLEGKMEHPLDAGPAYRDENGEPAVLVRCPDCGQMEWWTPEELRDHGLCRTRGGPWPECTPEGGQ